MATKRFMVAGAALAVAGCATAPQTAVTPQAPQADRTIASVENADIQAPTVEQMKAILPARLTADEARKVLVQVPDDQIDVTPPSADRTTQVRGFRGGHHGGFHRGFHRGFGRGFGFGGFGGFFPFGWGGSTLYSPYLWDPLLTTSLIPAYSSPYILNYPYLSYPFVNTFGTFSPFWGGLGFGGFGGFHRFGHRHGGHWRRR